MSSSSSNSENSHNDSEYNSVPGNIFEVKEGASGVGNVLNDISILTDVPYVDEP